MTTLQRLTSSPMDWINTMLDSSPDPSQDRHDKTRDTEQTINEEATSHTQQDVSNTIAHSQTNHCTKVDIIVPVYNALKYVKKCIASCIRHTNGYTVQLIIVNDGSDSKTSEYLRTVANQQAFITLINHPENRGYTKTINTGIKASEAAYVILLNSDTIVSKNWLHRLISCANRSSDIGIVGPLSNAASWQTVPQLRDKNGRFYVNELASGIDVDQMGGLIEKHSLHLYPEVPFVNGFCFLIKRSLINTIGLFDEINFPTGYGEENDYCLRATEARFSLVIADDSYVYHAKSKSFGHEQRNALSKKGASALQKKYGKKWFEKQAKHMAENPYLNVIRQSYSFKLFADLNKVHLQNNKIGSNHSTDITQYKILFILPKPAVGGGTHSIVQEVDAMRRLGVTAHVAIKARIMTTACEQYPAIPSAHELFMGFEDDTLLQQAKHYDIVIGTLFSSMQYVKQIVERYPHIVPAYYVQDYEPLFFEEGTENWQIAKDSYTLVPNALLFAKTHWIARQVIKHHGVYVHKVNPSIDGYIYYPPLDINNTQRVDEQDHQRDIHIAAMIRPRTPRRGAERTIKLLSKINKLHSNSNNGRLIFHLFGCEPDDAAFKAFTIDFDYLHHGILKRQGVANVLRKSDIFIDLSDYQAFGRTALEAMSCGCTAMVPQAGGADEYARHNENALVVDTLDGDHCLTELAQLLNNPEKLAQMKQQGLATSLHYSPQRAALSELNIFTQAVLKHRFTTGYDLHSTTTSNDNVLTASLLSLHDGSVAPEDAIYQLKAFMHPDVLEEWNVSLAPSNTLPDVDKINIALIQLHHSYLNTDKNIDTLKLWMQNLQAKGGKCVLIPNDADIDSITNARLMTSSAFKKPDSRFKTLLNLCDALIIFTHLQKQLYKKHHKKLIHLPSKLDKNTWLIGQPRPTGKGYYSKKTGDPVRIGFIGGQDSTPHLKLVKKALDKIKQDYADRVEIEVIGAFQQNPDNALFGQVIPLPKNKSYSAFINWLQMRVHWDIAILPESDQHPSKLDDSSIKFLECTALRVACICSNTKTYQHIIKDNKNGLLASNTTDSWYNAIKRLIDNKALRTELFTHAYTDLQQQYSSGASANDHLDALNTIHQLVHQTDYKKAIKNKKKVEQRRQKWELAKRRMVKLIREPYRYFYDSKVKAIRPLRYLFKPKILS